MCGAAALARTFACLLWFRRAVLLFTRKINYSLLVQRARSALAVRNNCALQQTNTRSGFDGGVIHLETSTLAEDHGIVCAQRARGKIRPSSGRTQNTFFRKCGLRQGLLHSGSQRQSNVTQDSKLNIKIS